MSSEYDWLFDAELPLLAVKGDKAPLHNDWPNKVLSKVPHNAAGLAIKLGGVTGFVDVEGDGLDAEETWDMLTSGLQVPIDYKWASSRGDHRLVHLPRDLAKAFALSGVVKIGDLEIRIGDHETYTHYSIVPSMGERRWLAFDFDFRPSPLPIEFWKRVAEFSRATGETGRVEFGPSDENASSPGTVYNNTAQWADILEPHGWKLFRHRGDINDWARPGKEELTLSATTGYTGDKLYVFSTNADPFEANRAYDKFGAFALLNYDGDLSEAAKQLARDGYVPSLEAELIFEPYTPIIASDGEIISDANFETLGTETAAPSSGTNEELYVPVGDLQLPGLVEMVSRYHVSRAHRDNPRAGAVAGIVLQSLLLSRRAALSDGTRPNVAILMAGGSGVGKTESVDTLKIILSELQMSNLVIEQLKSQQGLEDALFQDPVCVYAPEESQDLLMSMFMDGGGGPFAGIASSIKRFYTASKSTLRARVGVGATKASVVKYPHLSVWMTGIPSKIWDNMGSNMLDDGFLARLWNFELAPCPLRPEEEVMARGDVLLLADIIEHCKAWLDVQPGSAANAEEGTGEWVETVSEPLSISRTPAASILARQFADKTEAARAAADENDPASAATWARAYVSLCKLELIAAGSRTAINPVVEEADTARCIRIVEAMIRSTFLRIESRVAGGENQVFRKTVDRVKNFMVKKRQEGHGEDFTRSELGQGLRLRSEDLRNVLFTGTEWGIFATDAKVAVDGTKFATQVNRVRLKKSTTP